MSRARQRRPDLPGNQFVAVDILCLPCLRAGKRRVLCRFGRDTREGADREIWMTSRRLPDGTRALPMESIGPDGVVRVNLTCGCRHTPEVYADRLVEHLDAVEAGTLRSPSRWPL